MRLTFRRLDGTDLPLLHRWLNLPHVCEWWGQPGPTLEQVRVTYQPWTRGSTDVTPYVILDGEAPIGYIQCYPVPAQAWNLEIPHPAVGVDLFIGEPRYLHRGVGAHILRQFLSDVVFRDGSVTACYADPSSRNHVAIRAFEKAGFHHVGVVPGPDPATSVCLMRAMPAIRVVRYDPRWP